MSSGHSSAARVGRDALRAASGALAASAAPPQSIALQSIFLVGAPRSTQRKTFWTLGENWSRVWIVFWTELGRMWEQSCAVDGLDGEPFPLDEHELTLQAMSLNVPQCEALVADARARASDDTGVAWEELSEMCRAVSR